MPACPAGENTTYYINQALHIMWMRTGLKLRPRNPIAVKWLDCQADQYGMQSNFAIVIPTPQEAGWLNEATHSKNSQHAVTDIDLGDDPLQPHTRLAVPILSELGQECKCKSLPHWKEDIGVGSDARGTTGGVAHTSSPHARAR